MTIQEITIYREIQRNTENAMKAIDAISDKVEDKELALQMSKQSIKYAEIYNQAAKQLVAGKAEGYRGSAMANMMLRTGINYNTLFNTSTGHLAELMIKGSNMGILEMEKILKHNNNAEQGAVSLAQQLIEFEQGNIKSLKSYL